MEEFFKHFPHANIVVAPWDTSEKGFSPIQRKWCDFSVEELRTHNLKFKRAVYFTPCDMGGERHTLDNHRDVRAWYCDIDVAKRGEEISQEEVDRRKAEVLGRIFTSPSKYCNMLKPSFVVDTRNGFHLYWLAWHEKAVDNDYMPEGGLYKPSKEKFSEIEYSIVTELDGDIKACKLVQLMRLPGFYNWKNKDTGYGCRIIPEYTQLIGGELREYCEEEFDKFLIEKPKAEIKQRKYEDIASVLFPNKNDIFAKVENMDQEFALSLLSGRPEVNGEKYSFVSVGGGNRMNILINGVLCSAFIDKNQNKIFVRKGSGRGSPNVIEWLKYYNADFESNGKFLAETLKKIYDKK